MARTKTRDVLRNEMIVAAEHILADEGLAALQARTIAARVGCSVGTIYNVFGNIDELILVANAKTLMHLGELLAEANRKATSRDMEARLLSLALAYLDFASEHKKRWKAVFEHVLADSSSPVPVWYREAQSPLLGILADALPVSMKMHDKALMAQTLFSAAHGIVTLALDQKLSDRFDREMTEKQLQLLVKGAALSLGKAV